MIHRSVVDQYYQGDYELERHDNALLKVHVKNAKNLARADTFRKEDPYCVVTLGSKEYYTPILDGEGLNPVFDEMFFFPYKGETELKVDVFDHDFFRSPDDFLGSVTIAIDSLTDIDERMSLHHGDATIKLAISHTTGPWPTPSLKYIVHRHSIMGFLKAFEGNKLKPHKTWEIDLNFVNEVFHSHRQGWNKEYEAAQKIFNDQGGAVRAGLSLMNSVMYGENQFKSTMGVVRGGEQMLALLKYGKSSTTGKHHMYTYVIINNRLVFSETGKTFLADFMSKHALHAGASESVRYSGEFHISRTTDDKPVWVFDNNSGTYGPRKEDLPLLRSVLRRNFTGIAIECLGYDDPRLKEYLRRVKLIE